MVFEILILGSWFLILKTLIHHSLAKQNSLFTSTKISCSQNFTFTKTMNQNRKAANP
jgi:hypothetical protein